MAMCQVFWVTKAPGGAFNPNSKVEQSDLTQSTDRKEVFSILACINRYALEISATPIVHFGPSPAHGVASRWVVPLSLSHILGTLASMIVSNYIVAKCLHFRHPPRSFNPDRSLV